ncbi:GBS Bsp-like repeat-containing protein, partial [Streptococcus suis]
MKKKKYGFSKRTLLFAPVAISLLFGNIVQAEENTIEPSLPSSTDIAQEQQEDMTVVVQSSTNSSLEDTTSETATAVSEIEITKQGINSVDEKTTVQVEASVSLEQENDNDIENTENVSDSKEQETSISEISSDPTQRIFSKQSAVSNGEAEKSTASLPREYSPVIVPITSVEKIEQNLVVNYTRPIKSNEIVQFAVWSEKSAQDDIIWYNADKTGAAYVELRKHRDYGKYHVHTYSNANGKMVFLDKLELEVAEPVPSQKIIQTSVSTFDVIISNVPNYYSRIQVPTWTNSKNQDDIKWYEGVRQSDGSYKVSVDIKNHNYESGLYLVHSYGVLPNKKLVALAQATYTVPQPQTKQTITQTSLTSFDVVITGVPNYYTRVQIPTWTNNKNQDDIKWYEGVRQSDGSYKVSVDIKNHNYESGLYLVHSYGILPNKKLVALAQATYTVPQPQIKQTITQTSLTGFDVVITGVP